jgi:hypothetical protein
LVSLHFVSSSVSSSSHARLDFRQALSHRPFQNRSRSFRHPADQEGRQDRPILRAPVGFEEREARRDREQVSVPDQQALDRRWFDPQEHCALYQPRLQAEDKAKKAKSSGKAASGKAKTAKAAAKKTSAATKAKSVKAKSANSRSAKAKAGKVKSKKA